MMKTLAHLRQAGWFELCRSYPDPGSLYHVAWYIGILQYGAHGFRVIVAASAEGVRMVVGPGLSAVFVPWSQVAVLAERGWVDTLIRLETMTLLPEPLVLHLDDDDADAVLRSAGLALPARRRPWGPSLCIAGAIGVFLALLGAAYLVR